MVITYQGCSITRTVCHEDEITVSIVLEGCGYTRWVSDSGKKTPVVPIIKRLSTVCVNHSAWVWVHRIRIFIAHGHWRTQIAGITCIPHRYAGYAIVFIPPVSIVGTLGGTFTLQPASVIEYARGPRTIALSNTHTVSERIVPHGLSTAVGGGDSDQASLRIACPEVRVIPCFSIRHNSNQARGIGVRNFAPILGELVNYPAQFIVGVGNLYNPVGVDNLTDKSGIRVSIRTDTRICCHTRQMLTLIRIFGGH